MTERREAPGSLSAVDAGEVLGLPPDVVRVLADAGYLAAAARPGGVPRFALGDLKAFQARSADRFDEWAWDARGDDGLDVDALLELIGERTEEMAERSLDLFHLFLPESLTMQEEHRQRFLDEAGERIQAILTVCAHGAGGDETVEHDLADVGADAAHNGVPLPAVLVSLRVSRDLVVSTACDVAQERGRRWGLALAVALIKVIPAIDRLSDAVARGYWEALLEIEAEGIDRFRTVVDRVADGVFTTDASGVVDYANPALAAMLGRPVEDLVGRSADAIVDDRFEVRWFERLREGVVVGLDGVVSPVERGLHRRKHAGAAPGAVDEGDGVVDEDAGDRPERVGGAAFTEGDRGAVVAAEGDGGLERDLPE
jgi:PAS domain-containing protein